MLYQSPLSSTVFTSCLTAITERLKKRTLEEFSCLDEQLIERMSQEGDRYSHLVLDVYRNSSLDQHSNQTQVTFLRRLVDT